MSVDAQDKVTLHDVDCFVAMALSAAADAGAPSQVLEHLMEAARLLSELDQTSLDTSNGFV